MASSLVAHARALYERKPVRYSLVSVVAVAVSQLVLVTCNGVLDWSAVPSNLTAVAVGSIPSYVLNRRWVWGKRGRNHLWREVVPFWALAFLGLVFSTVLVHLAVQWKDSTVVASAANLTAFGILWVVKYLILDSLLFRVPEQPEALVS
ncbi:MAG: GtrA family protein [Actinomycetota bacterium]|nr:GtrA family protein [Actinomycetota bacterium]